jgi:hypothetical protein
MAFGNLLISGRAAKSVYRQLPNLSAVGGLT